MALPFFNWSRTALSNATADSTVNWAEGQAPSSVNDSARAMMASAAAFRDDIAGAIVTGGSATAYTVTSYQVFDTLAHLHCQLIAFTPHATNTAACTLNVDGLGAKQIYSEPNVALPSGALILGTPYVVMYRNDFPGFVLVGGMSNPYGVPLGGGMDFWGTTVPNSAFAFPAGQAISRTTYATLFAIFSTTFGVGDGSSTFNLPDKTGRISAMKEASATRLTSALSGIDGATLGAVGGSQSITLLTANLPSHSHTGTTAGMSANANHSHTYSAPNGSAGAGVNFAAGASTGTSVNTSLVNLDHSHDFTSNAAGSDTAHANAQPTIVCNYILRII